MSRCLPYRGVGKHKGSVSKYFGTLRLCGDQTDTMTSKVAQQSKVLATKPDNLSLIHVILMVKGKKIVLWPPDVHSSIHWTTHGYTNKQIIVKTISSYP